MARSDEAAAFFHAVYTAIQEVPYGKVTTYGHIAMLIGTRRFSPLISSPNHLSWPSSLTVQPNVLAK